MEINVYKLLKELILEEQNILDDIDLSKKENKRFHEGRLFENQLYQTILLNKIKS